MKQKDNVYTKHIRDAIKLILEYTKDVNREIFESFYQLLYELSASSMKYTQFIIIDKEFFEPDVPDERSSGLEREELLRDRTG